MHRRRQMLQTLCGAFMVAGLPRARAASVVDLAWDDLIPDGGGGTLLKSLRDMGVIEHGQLSTGFEQPEARAVTTAYNGQTVRLPGFVVPLDFGADGIRLFILAPFVGACIHVPPPPANQLVLVTSETPYNYKGLFDPVYVTGRFDTAAASTDLADIGYTLEATLIEPYDGP